MKFDGINEQSFRNILIANLDFVKTSRVSISFIRNKNIVYVTYLGLESFLRLSGLDFKNEKELREYIVYWFRENQLLGLIDENGDVQLCT